MLSTMAEEVLIKISRGNTGFGFSINGGNDQPHLPSNPGIFVTKIQDDGAAAKDGRLKVGDKILEINNRDVRDLIQKEAVDILSASKKVSLLVQQGVEECIRMSVRLNSLQTLNKRDLECSVCLERFYNPKTLKCLHTYCLHCLQSLQKTHGNIRCPNCRQTYDLNQEDLKKLVSNEMISYLLNHVGKIEAGKPLNCSKCDRQPRYHCSECQMYLCGEHIEQHKLFPVLQHHQLYTLDNENEQDKNGLSCPKHHRVLEDFCITCQKSSCDDCKDILRCYRNKHKIVSMQEATDDFNIKLRENIGGADDFKNRLKEMLNCITKDASNLDNMVLLCRRAIEKLEKEIIKKVQDKSKKFLSCLENIWQESKTLSDNQSEKIDVKLNEVNKLKASMETLLNKPEKSGTLRYYTATINAIKDDMQGYDTQKGDYLPIFVPSMGLVDLVENACLGQLTGVSKVVDNDILVKVTEGQQFTISVKNMLENDCQLQAFLHNSSGKETATWFEACGNGEYQITGVCNTEGDWQMKIKDEGRTIKGSPVNVKVEALGLIKTIGNWSDCEELAIREKQIQDIMLHEDGCILISSNTEEILKFTQSGMFVERIVQDVPVGNMHRNGNSDIFLGDCEDDCIIKCNNKFSKIKSFNNEILKLPNGFTVKNGILYVTDGMGNCVVKFDVNDGRLLGKFGSYGNKGGEMSAPEDITLTKDGQVIVADWGNNRIQLFDADGKFVRVIVGPGTEDGQVIRPHCVMMDGEDNLFVSSNHKLQLFNKDGILIKRIDCEDDGLQCPSGICLVSKRPRRVAVANRGQNNIKIFNY